VSGGSGSGTHLIIGIGSDTLDGGAGPDRSAMIYYVALPFVRVEGGLTPGAIGSSYRPRQQAAHGRLRHGAARAVHRYQPFSGYQTF
jgi:hypothetical protein